MARALPVLVVAALLLTGVLSGCGARTFSAEEFVEEANENGAGLVLGAPLPSVRQDAKLYSLEFEEPTVTPFAGDEAEQAHGGGTLTVTDDVNDGITEYGRCEAAASLLCFRAANVVLFFEDTLPPEARARITDALRAMAE